MKKTTALISCIIICNLQLSANPTTFTFENDSLKREIKDKAILDSCINSFSTLLIDSGRYDSSKIIHKYQVDLQRINADKNIEINHINKQNLYYEFAYNNNYRKTFIVIFIILLSGLIGAIIRIFFDKVSKDIDIEEKVQAENTYKYEGIKSTIDALNITGEDNGAAMKADAYNKIATQIDMIIKTNNENESQLDYKDWKVCLVNFLFCSVSALLSVILLESLNSDILKFKGLIDYIVFAAWCLMGSIFARRWFSKVYKSIDK